MICAFQLAFNTQLSMSIAPQLRREEDIKQVLILLCFIKEQHGDITD